MFAYVLFFGTGMMYALIARKMSAWSYKVGVGVALLAGFALGWSNMVHVADSENPANLAYFSVLAVGGIGAWLARLAARGLARTLFAMAAGLAMIAMMLPSGAPAYLARNMAILHGIFVALGKRIAYLPFRWKRRMRARQRIRLLHCTPGAEAI